MAGPAPRGTVFLNPLPDYDSDSANSEFMSTSTHTASSASSTSRLSQQEVLSLISGDLRLSIEPLMIPHYFVQLHDIVGKGKCFREDEKLAEKLYFREFQCLFFEYFLNFA